MYLAARIVMSDGSFFLPDPNFERRQKHFIDVLVPPYLDDISETCCKNEYYLREASSGMDRRPKVLETECKRNERAGSVKDFNRDGKSCNTHRRPAVTTPGYDLDKYDLEREVAINSHEKSAPTHRITKAESEFLPGCHPENNVGKFNKRKRVSSRKHTQSWEVFRKYLEQCIPVKIEQVSSFRDLSNREPIQHSKSLDSLESVLSCDVKDFPSYLLDTNVTVQCAFPANDTESFLAQKIDEALSFSTFKCGPDDIPTFMGQEDQITTVMRLREAVNWQQIKNPRNDEGGNHNQSKKSCMAVCVAQLPILTLSGDEDDEMKSARYDPFSCQTNSDQKSISSDSTMISVKSNGEVHKIITPRCDSESATSSTKDCDQSPAMETMASMLRLPSYLLMGDPNELDECLPGCDYTQRRCIEIHDINLWHAPQNCRTNVHYDDRDNLLMVTRGVKTVELCPPGCIRGSGVYSEHANHPYLLRKRTFSSSSNKQRNLEVDKTRQLKKDRTYIVSICEGEALYIPRGWWHRVESASNPHSQQRGGGCTAVNVWFDYRHHSCLPTHMRSFQLRQSARNYYNINKGDAITAILEDKRKSIWRINSDVDNFESIISKWKELNDAVFHIECWEVTKMRLCSKLLAECWEEIVAANNICNELRKGKDIVRAFRIALEMFLHRADSADVGHLKELVNLWHFFRVDSDKNEESSPPTGFETLVLGLSRESCFIITQAWERYGFVAMNSFGMESGNATKKCNLNLLNFEVEASYQHFFALVRERERERVRLFLFESVESFQHGICQSLLSALVSC
ncbi:hypothetical protein ACHAXS_005589 [Conticribra weissflogii]